MKEYALYNGDELLGVGTIKEIAKQTGLAEATLYHYKSPAYKRRRSAWTHWRELVDIEKEEDELQERIDRAIEILQLCNSECAREVIDILKGEDEK